MPQLSALMERPLHSTLAAQLQDTWERLAGQHVALGGAGCACGVGGVSLQLGDFEQDIVDFLLDHAQRSDRADILVFLEEHGRRAGDGLWSLPRLLTALGEGAAPAAVSEVLLAKLGKTLNSFAKLHG